MEDGTRQPDRRDATAFVAACDPRRLAGPEIIEIPHNGVADRPPSGRQVTATGQLLSASIEIERRRTTPWRIRQGLA